MNLYTATHTSERKCVIPWYLRCGNKRMTCCDASAVKGRSSVSYTRSDSACITSALEVNIMGLVYAYIGWVCMCMCYLRLRIISWWMQWLVLLRSLWKRQRARGHFGVPLIPNLFLYARIKHGAPLHILVGVCKIYYKLDELPDLWLK